MSHRASGVELAEDRLRAWAMGRDDEGPLRGAHNNCYVGTRRPNSRHRSRARQELGYPGFSSCWPPGFRDTDGTHWGSECPNKEHLVGKV